jgi:polysaccharide export outer membrane protein
VRSRALPTLVYNLAIQNRVVHKKMSLKFLTANGRLTRSLVATVLVLGAGYAMAQVPTPEQLNVLKSLPADQQQTLIQSVLGAKGDGTSRKTDPKLDMPDTDEERNGRSQQSKGELDHDKTIDGRMLRRSREDPELRAFDSVLIDLTPYELTPKSSSAIPSAGSAAVSNTPATSDALNALGAESSANKNKPGDFGRIEFDRPPTTPQEAKLRNLRERILKDNPYKLNRFGVLEIPGLPAIPLAGLTAEEATNRLSADPDLRAFTVKLTLLRLEPLDEEALKPFGYDLFEGNPSTFAPVKDIQVPIDYVVGPGDTLNVQLYGSETASYTFTVGRDGRINFPKLGPIAVSGMGFDDVRSVLERRVAQQLIGAKVSVTMGDLRSIRIFVLGEAQRPGSYSVSGLSTMTNALFVSGGVKPIGSLRNIQLKRNGRLVSTLDLYDLLLHGDTSADRQLLPGDVIFIPPIGETVSVYGAVRRPAIYELRSEKTVAQIVGLSGGLNADADGKLTQMERIEASRLRDMINVDLTSSEGRNTQLANGDLLYIPTIRPTVEHSVQLSGYVFRPGSFEYHSGMHLSDVLNSLDELRPNADRHYVMIRRETARDRKVEVVSADLEKALNARGSAADPELRPRDKIYVFDLTATRARTIAPVVADLQLQSSAARPRQIVSVDGQVRAPGRYPLEPGMRVSDLIRAGGSLQDSAYDGDAELTRYEVVDGKERQTALLDVSLADIRRGDLSADKLLMPYDLLVIKKTPQWDEAGSVTVTGEVRFPGEYPIHRGETLISLMKRVGGVTDLAFEEGAVFVREELKNREKDQLELLSNRLQSDLAALALEALTTSAVSSSAGGGNAAQGLAVGQQLIEQLRNTKPVGRLVINVATLMKGGAGADVLLRSGDKLLIPKKTQEITILGEVQSPTSHIYKAGLTRDDYIERSGGTTQKADRKRIYVVRANGDVITGGRSGWFRRTESVEIRPGDTIVVPLDTERVRGLPLWQAVTTIIYNLAVALLAVRSV